MTDPDDTERTDDAALGLGATAEQTEQTAAEEDGSSPDEPQPETFPADDEPPEPVVTTPDDPA
jgi:hypothetical protein